MDALNVDAEKYRRAIAIRQIASVGDERGKPVAWLELLSPSNKPGGSHAAAYAAKRIDVCRDGQTLVEIDYLHRSPPLYEGLPRYKPDAQGQVPPGASPYSISVIDPRPSEKFPEGRAVVQPFGVDEPLPQMTISLGDTDFLFDFGPSYDETFVSHYADVVDYVGTPLAYGSYSVQDRDRIDARRLTIWQAELTGHLRDEGRRGPLPLAFEVEGASERLLRVLRGSEGLLPPPPTLQSEHDR